ncbi:hypothetical protein SAMN04488030_2390 [Aliiroseovarius halocynthiae]|uniref:Uncharacterized protein n=1 Tax=Aliiroseovarius halocynthiae TaxID=985055 RepID=A0A545SZH6_9RHOB|nr:hypothetical protein [Aliiroseovarius halocynthiae]TQV70329.1 hypothetical protein FIL88_00005 [Aliiroseovarius halocynthiae]SMR81997.1 hypothetical protein SAMN04488030_2390 [Aliiroseovarius halocynthiae]
MQTEMRNGAADRQTRIRTIVALACIVVAVLSQTWLWGVLFAAWAAQGTLTGKAYLLEDLTSKNFPMLCRAINLVWFAIGLLMIVETFGPEWTLF